MAVNVAWNYDGNITGLFYTGPTTALPAALDNGHTWRVHDALGYDAQYYHVIAHDPLNLHASTQYLDNPRVRWRRIGVPGLAALLSAGSFRLVDWAYAAIEIFFTFLGAWWLSLYARSLGFHPLFGLAFLAIPAVLVSFDRLTVDLVLAALTAGLVWYTRSEKPVRWPLYAIMCFAPLVRETGMILVVGWCVWNALNRRWRNTATGIACTLPTLAWWAWVQTHTPFDGTAWLGPYPFSGLIERTLAGDSTPATTAWLRLAHVTENLALAGIWLSIALAFYLISRRRFGIIEITTLAFVAFDSLLGKYDIWDTAYAVGRTMSPLLLLLGLLALRDRRYVYAVPLAMILPRILLQYQAQLTAAIRHI
jgi:hypothetical protein